MCGRYSLIADLGELARRYEFDGDIDAFDKKHNIAPTQEVLTVVGGETRRAGLMRWGLIPRWAKDPKIARRMINARAETAAEKPAFRNALRRRRCLVLADGFYEWQRVPGSKTKRPMRIVLKTGEAFAFAGLWETWRDRVGSPIASCTILTTAANQLLAPIHDRMPVILARDAEALWLDSSVNDVGLLDHLLSPYDANAVDFYEVSTLVNSPANDAPEVLARVG